MYDIYPYIYCGDKETKFNKLKGTNLRFTFSLFSKIIYFYLIVSLQISHQVGNHSIKFEFKVDQICFYSKKNDIYDIKSRK